MDSPQMSSEDRREFPWALLAGIAVVGLLVCGAWFVTSRKPTGAPQEAKLPFSAVEQAYMERIHFKDIQMQRAANLLDQEITFVLGKVENAGARNIVEMEVVIEFRDLMNQVVLREGRRLYGKHAAPLPGGRSREFQFNFEHVPVDWNRQYPNFRVTGLKLED